MDGLRVFTTLFLFGLFHANEAGNAKFLGSQQRFSNSNFYDSYYCCNMCDGTLTWVVDSEVVVVHFSSRSSIGSVENYEDTSTASRYNSMILSRRDKGSETCVDVVLIATQTNPNWRPEVICRGNTQQHIIDYGDQALNYIFPGEVNNVSVTAKISLAQIDIVSPGNNYVTGVVVCRSKDPVISWKGNGSFLVTFNGETGPGSFDFQQHSVDPTVVLWETVVLDKSNEEITSVIVGTDVYSDNVRVSCLSRHYEASLTINSNQERSITTFSGDDDGNEQLSTNTLYAGSMPLASCIATVAVFVGLSIMLAST